MNMCCVLTLTGWRESLPVLDTGNALTKEQVIM